MGKRIRSLGIHFGDHEIHITKHAAWRFLNRAMHTPTALNSLTPNIIDKVTAEVRTMVSESSQVIRVSGHDDRVYLANDHCVFVMTHHGTIVTVLSKPQGSPQFAQSIKDVRRGKRTADKRPHQRTRRRRTASGRHQRDSHGRHHSHDDED